MNRFFILTNEQKDPQGVFTEELAAYIREKGGSCVTYFSKGNETEKNLFRVIPSDTQCVLCIGGDGTFIRTARELVELQIPLIGIQQGHMGYLCEIDGQEAKKAIDAMLSDRGLIEERMLLSGFCTKKEEPYPQQLALNDFVIHRSGKMQLIHFIVKVNGNYLTTYGADGVIVATPTGSTAYNLSAAGPIVDPQAELLLITPICPHTPNARSIVLGKKDEITIEIGSRSIDRDEEVEVSVDGDTVLKLGVGDSLTVKRAPLHSKIYKISEMSFLEILRKKMKEQ